MGRCRTRFYDDGGSRQIFDMKTERVADSCGTGVPVMTVEADRRRTDLEPYDAKMSEEQLNGCWSRKKAKRIDGLPTEIFGDEIPPTN